MRNTKNAFTLVELIVVITILAILGTIAFISLQGYSADARNSKRTSDLGNLQSSISLKQVEWVPLLSFIVGTGSTLSGGLDVAWKEGVTNDTEYRAGTPNYTALNVIEKDFKDPKWDNEYRIGATTYKGWVFQIAATMEQDGTATALVNGTYDARGTEEYTVKDISGNTFTLDDNHANRFKVGDVVTDGANGTGSVDRVSRDGITLTLSTGALVDGSLGLAEDESEGLIAGKDTPTTAIENLKTVALPY